MHHSNKKRMPLCRTVVLMLLLMLLSACSLLPNNTQSTINEDQARLIAQDFAQVLAMLPGYAPQTTTVQFRSIKEGFAKQLEQTMRIAGFGVQIGQEEDARYKAVSFDTEQFTIDSGTSVGYRIQVGSVQLAREYKVQQSLVSPLTGMSVRGAPIIDERLDDNLFQPEAIGEESSSMAPGTPTQIIQARSAHSLSPLSQTDRKDSRRNLKERLPIAADTGSLDVSPVDDQNIELIPVSDFNQWQMVTAQQPDADDAISDSTVCRDEFAEGEQLQSRSIGAPYCGGSGAEYVQR